MSVWLPSEKVAKWTVLSFLSSDAEGKFLRSLQLKNKETCTTVQLFKTDLHLKKIDVPISPSFLKTEFEEQKQAELENLRRSFTSEQEEKERSYTGKMSQLTAQLQQLDAVVAQVLNTYTHT